MYQNLFTELRYVIENNEPLSPVLFPPASKSSAMSATLVCVLLRDIRTDAKVGMTQIELKAEDPYNKDKVNLKTIVLDDVFTLLQRPKEGLTEVESKEQNAFLQFLGFIWNPLSCICKDGLSLVPPLWCLWCLWCLWKASRAELSLQMWVMEGTALVAIALSNSGGCTLDWPDFVGIVLLLLINSAIGFYKERNTGNAVKALMDLLARQRPATMANGPKLNRPISFLVIWLPSRLVMSSPINASIDQATLTGESLPQSKKSGFQCFLGSTCKQGQAEGVVISTSGNTFFSSAAPLIGSFCLVSIGLFVLLEIVILYPCFHYSCHRWFTLPSNEDRTITLPVVEEDPTPVEPKTPARLTAPPGSIYVPQQPNPSSCSSALGFSPSKSVAGSDTTVYHLAASDLSVGSGASVSDDTKSDSCRLTTPTTSDGGPLGIAQQQDDNYPTRMSTRKPSFDDDDSVGEATLHRNESETTLSKVEFPKAPVSVRAVTVT
ncbi:ATPase 9, plasma membrane-type [Rhizoctonia solani]|uniref:ATPase 9, plasma membrane-type n=1 Tax=Rhizoctonia solani TaxID=456999 RepID=A0A0K6GD78_9AGAM|nr:ATPase 9, plasma membrane-type [Rhizoctonia solani]